MILREIEKNVLLDALYAYRGPYDLIANLEEEQKSRQKECIHARDNLIKRIEENIGFSVNTANY